jgi:hypothetical protein
VQRGELAFTQTYSTETVGKLFSTRISFNPGA